MRIDPAIQARRSILSEIFRQSLNERANEALWDFVVRRGREVDADPDAILANLSAYRESDPRFEHLIADYVDAEASLREDSAEGYRAKIGPEQRKMLELLDS